jgi:hypothetical protein
MATQRMNKQMGTVKFTKRLLYSKASRRMPPAPLSA